MDQQFQIRTIAWLVAPDNEPLFSEIATTIRINDHAAGEFNEVEQGESGKIKLVQMNGLNCERPLTTP